MTPEPVSPIARNIAGGIITVMAMTLGALMLTTIEARPPIRTTTTVTLNVGITVPSVAPSTTERTTTLPPTIATWGPDRPPPTPSVPTIRSNQVASPRQITSTSTSTRSSTTPTVYYATCAEARAAGVAPIPRGAPGYRPPLDRDGDGLACETGGGSASTTTTTTASTTTSQTTTTEPTTTETTTPTATSTTISSTTSEPTTTSTTNPTTT